MALTYEQKLKVIELRGEGNGYKSIASLIGCEKGQVRGFLLTKHANDMASEVNVDLDAIHVSGPALKFFTCKQCGNEYARAHSEYKSYDYCSRSCSATAKVIARAEKEKAKELNKYTECRTCGVTFKKKGSSIYCSKECSEETLICEVCSKPFKKKRSNNVNQKICSRKCAVSLMKLTHEEYYKKFSDIHKGNIVPMDLYTGTEYEIKVWCIHCQKETVRKAGQFIDTNRVRGCTHCRRTLSTGENRIESWLNDNNVAHIKQYTVDGLVDKAQLRYDFAILNDNGDVVKLIEYDGRQHFEPVESFGGQEEFERQKNSDRLKNEYAKDNCIELIRISYKKKNSLETMLSNLI